MDLETGKIIQEITADENNVLSDMTHEKKLDELSHSSLILAMNQKNLFKIDPRVSSKEKAV